MLISQIQNLQLNHSFESATFFEIKSRTQEVFDNLWSEKKVRLFFKRDDELHPTIGGNKFRKLKYTVKNFGLNNKKGIITCGGAFSNHIAAVAAVGKIFNIPTIAFVRANEFDARNPTLVTAINNAIQLFFIERKAFSNKIFLETQAAQQFPDFLWLPEGGTNNRALQGCAEIFPEICTDLGFTPNFVAASGGTGGTLAGLLLSMKKETQLLGFHSLKGDFLKRDIEGHLQKFYSENPELTKVDLNNFQVFNNYHFGGYACSTPELIHFINNFKLQHSIALDPIYTGKLVFGVLDLIEKDFFPKNSTIVIIHSGGLQGIAPFNIFKLKMKGAKLV